LTVNIAGGGTIHKDPDRGTFGYLEQVSLSANADTGWTFAYWSGDASGTDNPLIFTMDGNTSITANFTQIEYTLTVIVDPLNAGSVTVDPAQPPYHYGDTTTLTAYANTGWTFAGWEGDVISVVNPLTVMIQANTSITARFALVLYKLFLPMVIR
jgi:uncharacterized repeat protein (TIGR02543 family)